MHYFKFSDCYSFQGDDIWQQIDHLSELTGMDLQGVNQPIVQQAQNLNGNYKYVLVKVNI